MTNALKPQEIESFIKTVDGWALVSDPEMRINALKKIFKFEDFKAAWDFASQCAVIFEQHNHHPDMLLTGYKYVEIKTTTHDINNQISDRDTDLVLAIEEIV